MGDLGGNYDLCLSIHGKLGIVALHHSLESVVVDFPRIRIRKIVSTRGQLHFALGAIIAGLILLSLLGTDLGARYALPRATSLSGPVLFRGFGQLLLGFLLQFAFGLTDLLQPSCDREALGAAAPCELLQRIAALAWAPARVFLRIHTPGFAQHSFDNRLQPLLFLLQPLVAQRARGTGVGP